MAKVILEKARDKRSEVGPAVGFFRIFQEETVGVFVVLVQSPSNLKFNQSQKPNGE